jgi:hypothetical protein
VGKLCAAISRLFAIPKLTPLSFPTHPPSQARSTRNDFSVNGFSAANRKYRRGAARAACVYQWGAARAR